MAFEKEASGGGGGGILMVIAIIVGLGIVWATTGGPERAERQGLFIEAPPPAGGGRTYSSLEQSKSKTGGAQGGAVAGETFETSADIERELARVEAELKRIQEELAYIQEHGEQSPYKGKVTLERTLSGVRQSDPVKEYVVMKAASGTGARIIVSGWRLESAVTGSGASLPLGTPLPSAGSVNSKTAIVLEAGERAYITTGRSPVGTSFRTNICTGYFEQFQDFSPALRKSCPDPDNELYDFGTNVAVTDDACYTYVSRLPRCSMVITSTPLQVTNACWLFVTKNISYSGCVENHRGDANFFGKEWRIFLGQNDGLWRERREIIKLLDERGRIVDTLTY